jgi:hypothetical protein
LAGVKQYVKKAEGLAEIFDLVWGTEVDEVMDSGWLGWQVVVYSLSRAVAYHRNVELALEQLAELGAGTIDCLLVFLTLAPGNRAPPWFQAGGGSVPDDSVKLQRQIPGLYQAAQWWYLVELVALGDEFGGASLDNLASSL